MVRFCPALLALVCLLAGAAAEDPPEAVKVALKKGIDAVQSGNVAEGIGHLERVVKEAPRVGHYRFLLAAAYSQARRNDDAWVQLRKAVLLDPSHRLAGQTFERMWQIFDESGTFNPGGTAASVAAKAGEPDAKSGRNGDERWTYGFMAVELRKGLVYQVIDTRGFSRIPEPAATWRLPLDRREWSIGHRGANRRGTLAEWVQNGETAQNWTRLFVVQRMFGRGGSTSARALVKKIEADLKRYCPRIELKVLKDGDRDLLYEWSIPEGAGPAPQHELVRLVIGRTDAHRLAYTGHGPQFGDEERARALRLLGESRLVARD